MKHQYYLQKTSLTINGVDGTANYKLVGIVVHKQLHFGLGHYTAFVRSRLDESQWYHMDDGEVGR